MTHLNSVLSKTWERCLLRNLMADRRTLRRLFTEGRSLLLCQRPGARMQIHFKFESVQVGEDLCLSPVFAVSAKPHEVHF